MSFGTPTPVFYEIASVALLAFIITALGFNALVAFVLGVFTAYVLFIASLGGFARSEHFAMAAGWGILVMIPASLGFAVATGAGVLVRLIWKRTRGGQKSATLKNGGAAASADDTVEAMSSYRAGKSITSRCGSCGDILTVKPAKPKPGRDPDALRVTCSCGKSNGTYAGI